VTVVSGGPRQVVAVRTVGPGREQTNTVVDGSVVVVVVDGATVVVVVSGGAVGSGGTTSGGTVVSGGAVRPGTVRVVTVGGGRVLAVDDGGRVDDDGRVDDGGGPVVEVDVNGGSRSKVGLAGPGFAGWVRPPPICAATIAPANRYHRVISR
jgi:hypothetical protein